MIIFGHLEIFICDYVLLVHLDLYQITFSARERRGGGASFLGLTHGFVTLTVAETETWTDKNWVI